MRKAKLVSIIVVNWNGEDVLEDCVNSLLKMDYQNWELILVDNGSTDRSIEYLEKIKSKNNIKIIKNDRNLGFAPANNQGYDASKGEYVLLLNNDTKVASNLLSKLVAKMENDKNVGIIQPKIYLMDKPGYLDNAGSFITKIGFWHHWGFMMRDSKEFSKEREVFSAKGACMLIRRKIIEKVGLFDPDFVSYFEETDLCWRALLVGYKVLFFPDTHIFHKVGYTIRRLSVIDNNYHYYKNRIASQLKNFEMKNIFLITIPHIIISLGIAFVFLFRGNFENFIMIFKAIGWNIVNIATILTKRGQIQSVRSVNDDNLFATLSVSVNWKKFFGDFKRVEEDIKRKTI